MRSIPTKTASIWRRLLSRQKHGKDNRRRPQPRLELLETRDLPAAGLRETYMLQLVNRLRISPADELPRLLANPDINAALTFFNVNRTLLQQQWTQLTPAAPLAWNDQLATAALTHSQLMLQFDVQEHVLPGEKPLADRIADAGYAGGDVAENIYAYAKDAFFGEGALAIDWGTLPQDIGGIQTPAEHRTNILSPNFTEIGIGLVDTTAGKATGPLLLTQNFGKPAVAPANPFLLGVVFKDTNSNNLYDMGEGLGGVTVSLDGPGGMTTVQTSAAGYYQTTAAAGAYTVTVSGGGLAAPVVKNATVGTSNVQVDFPTVDPAPGPATLQLATATTSVPETTGTVTLTVTRTGNATTAVSVPVTVAAGTATTPANFTLVTTQVNFAANVLQQQVQLNIVNVAGANGDLNFTVNLGAPAGGAVLGAVASTAVTIKDSDQAATANYQLDQTAYTIGSNGGQLTITIVRAGTPLIAGTIHVATSNGTAVAGVDFTKVDQDVAFAAGETQKTVSIPILNNANAAATSSFTINLTAPTGGTLGAKTSATVTIQKAAAAQKQVQLSQATYSVKEDAGQLAIKATRTGDTTQDATIDFAVTDGTGADGAKVNVNYTVLNSFFVFAANATQAEATINILKIAGYTGPLTFTVTLTAQAGGETIGNPGAAVITITDIDQQPGGANATAFKAKDDQFMTRPGDTTSVGASLFSNDTDANGQPLAAGAATAKGGARPAFGDVNINADGTFSFKPGPNFWGVDTFTYQVLNGTTPSNTATVTIVSHFAVQVRKVYQQVLKRDPELGGWKFWTDQLTGGTATLGSVASGIFESRERLDPIITTFYKTYLLRNPDQSGLDYWRGIWQRDGGPENVYAGMVSSAEFFGSAGAANPTKTPNEAWVTELYNRLLKRVPEASGFNYWLGLLNAGTLNRFQVVLGFVRSPENYANLAKGVPGNADIPGWYPQYLNRAATQAEVDAVVKKRLAGASERDIQIELINTQEYLNAPPPPAAGTATRLG